MLIQSDRGPASFFRTPTHALNLAVFRVVVFAQLLWILGHTNFVRHARMPAELRVPPAGWEPFFHLIPMSDAFVTGVWALAGAACFLALIGWKTRIAAAVATLTCLYLLALPELYGKINHVRHPLIWFAALCAAGRSGDALAVDAALAGRRPEPAVAYALPLRFAWLLIGVAYFFPGLWKLLAGPEWFLGDNLKFILYDHWASKGFPPPLRLDQYPLLYRAGGFGVVAFELSFVFLILSPWLRPVAVVAGLAFHTSTATFLYIQFRELALCYVAFFDWAAIAGRVGLGSRASAAAEGGRLRQPRAAIVVVGSILLAANVWCGVWDIDSWPFSVFPGFERIRRVPEAEYLEVVLARGGGDTEALQPAVRSSALRRLVVAKDPDDRARRLRGLRKLLAQDGLVLAPGETLRFYSVTRSTVPGEGRREIARELLLEVTM